MIFDTHTHYDNAAFDEDRDELLMSLLAAGIGKVVNVGASIEHETDGEINGRISFYLWCRRCAPQ